jgi:hypothetical protein
MLVQLYISTPYRQTQTSVKQIMLVQSYMFLHRTIRLKCPADKLCLSTVQLNISTPYRQTRTSVKQIMLVQRDIYTPYRQTRTSVKQIMLVQSYMFLHCTVRLECPAGKLCLSSSTCMYTIQAGTNACQANYAGPALHVCIQIDSTPVRQIMLVQLYMYVHHTGRHELLVQPYMYITYIGHSGMNFRQANYAGLTLHVHTTYRQTQTFVKQIILVQIYMYFHHADRLECLSNKLFWSSSTCAYT